MREMNKLLIGGLAAIALTLTGCTTTASEPAATITVTAQPTKESSSSGGSSSVSKDDTFMLMMVAAGTPSWLLEGETLTILEDQAKNTCEYIRDGMTKEEITLALFLVLDGSADQVVEDAFLAATVASTYSYCPEYEGFWD